MPRTTRFRRNVIALVLVATAACGALTLGAGAAGAAGDAKLDKYVVAFKAPGWTAWSAADAAKLVDAERASMKAVTSKKTLIAAKGWENDSGDRVFVVLSAFSQDIGSAEQNAKAAVISTCASAIGESPTNQKSFKGGDAGSEGTCKGTSSSGNDVEATVISFVKGNTIALVVGTGATAEQIESLAKKQAKALPGAVLV